MRKFSKFLFPPAARSIHDISILMATCLASVVALVLLLYWLRPDDGIFFRPNHLFTLALATTVLGFMLATLLLVPVRWHIDSEHVNSIRTLLLDSGFERTIEGQTEVFVPPVTRVWGLKSVQVRLSILENCTVFIEVPVYLSSILRKH